MIEFQKTGKQFGGKWAVRGLTLAVGAGEIFGLLGPNGAGKTTAIRMMTGLIRPNEGRVLIGGHDIIADPIAAKSVSGYIPDKSYVYEKLSGREFLGFMASLYGIARNETAGRIDGLLNGMGIADVGDELIESYSHGMRQRLLFAAALIHDPRVLIIDEPFVGLDPYGVRTIRALLVELAQKGIAVFLATHSLHIAQDLCDRAGIIHKGALISVMEKTDFAGERGGLEERFLRLTS